MSRRPEAAIAEVFSALGDATRLAVLRELETAPRSATALSEGAAVTRQAIAKHLGVLEGARLVTREKRGREVLYALDARRLDEARAFLEAASARWDRALVRLRRMVEEPPGGGSTGQRSPKRTGAP
jgi:DNA-binding transcriptional ArsR family regulator